MTRTGRWLSVVTLFALVALPTAGRCAVPAAHWQVAGGSSTRVQTARELTRLRRAAVLPNSRRPRSSVSSLRHPALDLPASPSRLDRAQFYRVPMPLRRVIPWFNAHRPAKLHLTAEGKTTSAGKSREVFVEYNGQNTDAYLSPTLEYSVKPLSRRATMWRVDEMALWLTTRPRSDARHGHSMRVVPDRGCPVVDAGRNDVSNPASDLATQLLPAAQPDRALICTYSGLNDTPEFTLQATTHLGARAAGHLAATVHAISLNHMIGIRPRCAADSLRRTVLAFQYQHRAPVDLWYERTGCKTIRNGHTISGDVDDKHAFYAQVAALTGRRPSEERNLRFSVRAARLH